MVNYWQREKTVKHTRTEWRMVLACCVMLVTGIYIYQTQRIQNHDIVVFIAPVMVPAIAFIN